MEYRYTSTELADYLTVFWKSKGKAINLTMVQKLLFITYGIYLAWKNERLIKEQPEAWPYGPVFPSTRKHLLKNGFPSKSINDPSLEKFQNDGDLQTVLKIVFDTFKDYNANRLVAWTHRDGSPWDLTTKERGFDWGKTIDDEKIRYSFKESLLYE